MNKAADKLPETNLDDLIARIQREGVQEAEIKAAQVIETARQEAESLKEKARREAAIITADAEEEIKRREAKFKQQMTLAGRDIILTVKREISTIFEHLLRQECQSCLTGKPLEALLVKLIENWRQNRDNDIEVLLNEQEKAKLSAGLLAAFQELAQNGIEVKGHPDIEAGFRISLKEGHCYYDFTDQAIAETLAQYLGPELAKFL